MKSLIAISSGVLAVFLVSGCGGDDVSLQQETMTVSGSSEGEVLFENSGENCRNFLIMAPILEENARKFVPEEFALVQPPIGFVELADCPSGTINGVDSGPYRIAEAAVFITPPDGSDFPPIIGNQAIYLLWQLDNNPELARLKTEAGFFGGLVEDIVLTVEDSEMLPILKQGFADVPFEYSPYQLSAELTPDSPPGPPLPNGLWHLGAHGVVTTYNDIYATDQVLAGPGTITLQEGSALHELFGATTVTGLAASGIGSFHNTTRLRQDIQATPPQ